MSKRHSVFLLLFFLVLAAIYLFGQIKPKDKRKLTANPVENASSFNFENYVGISIESADSVLQLEINGLLESIENASDTKEKSTLLRSLVSKTDKFNAAISGYYLQEVAEITLSRNDWLQSGDRYSSVLAVIDNPQMIDELKARALNAYENAKTDSADHGLEVRISNVYLESGGDDVMTGVQGLLNVVKEDPNNMDALLLLGKFGVISGQYNKAITRLEKVVSSQPRNIEALFLLAEAFRGSGKVEDAIEMLNRCKKEVNDAQLESEIEAYINKIK